MKTDAFVIAIFLIVSSLSVSSALADTAGGEMPQFIVPTGKITLQDAIKAALANNPDIAAASHEIYAPESAGLQEGLLENPIFFSVLAHI